MSVCGSHGCSGRPAEGTGMTPENGGILTAQWGDPEWERSCPCSERR